MQESDSDKAVQLHCHGATVTAALAVLPDSFLFSSPSFLLFLSILSYSHIFSSLSLFHIFIITSKSPMKLKKPSDRSLLI